VAEQDDLGDSRLTADCIQRRLLRQAAFLPTGPESRCSGISC
jgi:hypothetical protein